MFEYNEIKKICDDMSISCRKILNEDNNRIAKTVIDGIMKQINILHDYKLDVMKEYYDKEYEVFKEKLDNRCDKSIAELETLQRR